MLRAHFLLRLACLVLLPIAGVLLPMSARAIFSDGEARQQILQLRTQIAEQQRAVDARLAELEAQARNRSIIDLFNQVEMLRAELSRLRGLAETLQNELDNAQRRQRDLYVDLDQRTRKLESALTELRAAASAPAPATASAPPTAAPPTPGAGTGTVPTTPGSAPPAAAPVDPAAEQRLYDAALELVRAGRYADALATFQSFLRMYARSTLAPSAQYWLGNSLYALRDYRGAIAAQRLLLSNWPDSNKAPDALLNIATSQAELGEIAAARATLQDVIARYPASEAAAKARQRLGQR